MTSLVGQGGLRFLLTYTPEKLNPAYAQLLVDVDDAKRIDALAPAIEADLAERYPDALSYVSKFELGPGANGKIHARFSGPDPDVLRRLASQAEAIMHADPDRQGDPHRLAPAREADASRCSPRSRPTRTASPGPTSPGRCWRDSRGSRSASTARGTCCSRSSCAPQEEQRADVASIRHLQIWSPAAQAMIPLRQVVSGFETTFEDEIIMRRDRKRTITVFADPKTGPASVLFERLRPQIEAIPLPDRLHARVGRRVRGLEGRAGLAAREPPGLRPDHAARHHRAVQLAAPAADHLAVRAAGDHRRDRWACC